MVYNNLNTVQGGRSRMYKIVKKEWLSEKICLMEIRAEALAKSAQPGQFLIVKTDEHGERVPLTVCDYDREKGTVTIVFVIGKSTEDMGKLNEGEYFQDVAGPLGQESEFLHEDLETLKKKKFFSWQGEWEQLLFILR